MADFDLPPPPPDEDVSEEEASATPWTDGITADIRRNRTHPDPVVSAKAGIQPTQPIEI